MDRAFEDRGEAGRALARELAPLAGRVDLLVLGLPRGGVPVAFEVARCLSAPLDVFVVRKLGVPGNDELAFGAIASDGIEVRNPDIVTQFGLGEDAIAVVVDRERDELHRREKLYRQGRPYPSLDNSTVILVDDGIATGASIRAAARAIRSRNPAEVLIAVPVASASALSEIADDADRVICLAVPARFRAVGEFYRDFRSTTDDEVRDLLARAERGNAEGRNAEGKEGRTWQMPPTV